MKSLRLGLQLSKEQPSFNYKPLIDYRNSTSVDENGNRVLRNLGKLHEDVFPYSRQGVYFNGEDHSISLPENITRTDEFTMIATNDYSGRYNALTYNVFVSGTLVGLYAYDEDGNSKYLTHTLPTTGTVAITYKNLTISIYLNGKLEKVIDGFSSLNIYGGRGIGERYGYYTSGIVGNYIYINKALTSREIEYHAKYQERFLYTERVVDANGSKNFVLHSEILSGDTLDCVKMYLPMCEKDRFIRDMKNYNEVILIEENFNENIDGWSDYNDNSETTFENGRLRLTKIEDTDASIYAIKKFDVEEGKYYKITVNVYGSNSFYSGARIYSDDYTYLDRSYAKAVSTGKELSVIVKAIDNSLRVYLLGDIQLSVNEYIEYDDVIIEEVDGIYEIINFTTTCRSYADRLINGFQTIFCKRDYLGVPIQYNFNTCTIENDYGPLVSDLTDRQINEINNGVWQLEFIVKRESTGITGYLLDSYDYNNSTGFRIIIEKSWNISQTSFYIYNGDGYTYQTIDISDGNPHHIYFCMRGEKHEIFVDGVSDGQGEKDGLFAPSGLKFFNPGRYLFCGELRRGITFTTKEQNPLELYNEAVRKGLLDD